MPGTEGEMGRKRFPGSGSMRAPIVGAGPSSLGHRRPTAIVLKIASYENPFAAVGRAGPKLESQIGF